VSALPAAPRTARSLYGLLLAVAPTFIQSPDGTALYSAFDATLELRILGKSDSFRRVELSRMAHGIDDCLEPSPCIQLICQVDLQAACVVAYTDAHTHPASYFVPAAVNVLQPPNRIVSALASRFFADLVTSGCRLDRSSRLTQVGPSD
jgi:hypothetical protein